jgi:hypothetical protein
MRIGVAALLAATFMVPLAPAAEAGPRSRSRYYAPRSGGHSHHDHDDGWAVAGGIAIGTMIGVLLSRPAPPPRRVVVYEGPPAYVPPPAPPAAPPAYLPAPTGIVHPTTPAPAIDVPAMRQVWIPPTTVWRETRVVEPAVYQTRQIPAYEEVEVPVYEERQVPVTQEVVEPVLESRYDPVTRVWSSVKVGETRRTVVVGTRVERVPTGTRVERRPAGTREVRILVKPETTRIVRVPEQVPGRWAWLTTNPDGTTVLPPSDGAAPAPEAPVPQAPVPEAPIEPEPQAAPRNLPPAPPPPTPTAPVEEPALPTPIHPR